MRSKSNLSAASCPQLQQYYSASSRNPQAKNLQEDTSIRQVCVFTWWQLGKRECLKRRMKLISNCFHQERREKGTTVWRHRVAQPETCKVDLCLWRKGFQREFRVERKIDEKAQEFLYIFFHHLTVCNGTCPETRDLRSEKVDPPALTLGSLAAANLALELIAVGSCPVYQSLSVHIDATIHSSS